MRCLKNNKIIYCFVILCLTACNLTPSASDITPTNVTTPPPAQPQRQTLPDYSPYLPQALIEQATPYRFRSFDTNDGLSQSVVNYINQDEMGFMWFGTQDGLNRFDGYDFQVYKNDPQDPSTISSNFINVIEKDQDGIFWISTVNGGLNKFDPLTGQVSIYLNDPVDVTSLSENNTTDVCISRDGMIWIGTPNKGLNLFNPQTEIFLRYTNDPENPNSLSSNSVYPIMEDQNGNIWVGTSTGGVNRFDHSSGEFSRFMYNPQAPNSISSNGIQSLYEDQEGIIWIGTADAGLNRYDPKTELFTRYLHDSKDPYSISHNSVASIYEDHLGRFWVGTIGGGLNLLDRKTGKFIHFRNNPVDTESIPNDQILTIYEDKSGLMWFGTFGAGAATYDPFRSKFLHLRSLPDNPNSLNNSMVWTIYQDKQERLWVGTVGGGINLFNPNTGLWQVFTTENSNLSDNQVYQIFEDRSGNFWIGTAGGLDRLDIDSGEIENIVPSISVVIIKQDSKGMIWVGTVVNGLIRLNPDTLETEYFVNDPNDPISLGSNMVFSLLEDEEQTMWVGTSGAGLNRFNPDTGKFKRYIHYKQDPKSIGNNTVVTMFQTSDNTLWIGTTAGLDRFDRVSETFSHYTEKEGLPNEMIYAGLEDNDENIWITTNRGLSRFNRDLDEFTNFTRADGLQNNEFNQGCAYKDENGILYFCGINGVNIFLPDLVQENAYVPPVLITGFSLFNRPIKPGPDSVLKQPIEISNQIDLKYTDDFFEFTFAALHYSAPGQNMYAYKMENLDDDWNYIGNRRIATYTNVEPGEYVFRVKASNSDGVWNETGTSLRIIIPPPFWQTTWFRILVALFLVGIILTTVWLRIRTIEAQRRRLEVQVEERTHQLQDTMFELEKSKDAAESANRAKSVFLANMSHEFRTPLNAILGFTQIMDRDGRLKSDQRENIGIIHRSSEYLLGLINDVLEMSKIEAGRTTVVEKNFDLGRMLASIEEIFKLRAAKKGIRLEFGLDDHVPECVRTDEGKLRQILMNLLGNAVKFTQRGQVRMLVTTGSQPPSDGYDTLLQFEVEDTGPGIAPDDIEKIFQPFVQTLTGMQSQEGTGLGLSISRQFVELLGGNISVKSKPGKGSVFKFTLPVNIISREELEAPRPSRRVVGLESDQPIYRILVVDDNEVNRHLLVKLFTPVGFEIREAGNGQEALEVWESWEPHLIIMDMRMPVMDGYEATRRIKATTRGQATIIIALTASGLEEDKIIILSEGCDDYIRKPFREEDLFQMISKYLGVRYIYQDIHPEDRTVREHVSTGIVETADQESDKVKVHFDSAWLDSLERATILGDEQTIMNLADETSELDEALSQTIINLAVQYEHDKLIALINKIRENQNNEPN